MNYKKLTKIIDSAGDAQFIPLLSKDLVALKSIRKEWEQAEYTPDGIDDYIDKLYDAQCALEELLLHIDDSDPDSFFDNED